MTKPAMPTNMMNLYGQNFNTDLSSTLSNVLESAGGNKGYGSDMFTKSGDTGMMMQALMPNYAEGGAVNDALAIARQHFSGGGHPHQVGAYNFHPQFQGDRDALIRAILAEARGEGDAGMSAVAHNVMNRVHAGYRGNNDIQSTLLDQNKAGTAGQYTSFVANNPANIAGRNAMKIPMDSAEYRHAGEIADNALGGIEQDPTHGSSHYRNAAHSSAASDKWANQLGNKMTIGHHSFGTERGFHIPENNGAPNIGDQDMLNRMPQGNSAFSQTNSLADRIARGEVTPQDFGQNNMAMPASMQGGPWSPPPPSHPNMGPPMPAMQGPPMPSNVAPPQIPTPPVRPDHFGPMVNAPMPPNRPEMGPGFPMSHQNVGPGLPMAHANMGPMQSEMGWKPPMEIADRAPNALINQSAENLSPAKDIAPAQDISPANAFSAPDAPNSLVSADIGSAPVFDPPMPIGGDSVPFDSLADIFSGFNRGGRAGFSIGGDAQEEQSQALPMMAREDPNKHIADALRYAKVDEGERLREAAQAPMNPGLQTAVDFATYSMASPDTAPQRVAKAAVETPDMLKKYAQGMYNEGKDAFGYFGDTVTGNREFDINDPEAIKASTFLGGLAMTGAMPMASPEGALRSGIGVIGHNGGPVIEGAVEAAPQQFQHLINPAGMASRGYEFASTGLPAKATWQEMERLLTDPQKGRVTPEEMLWADFQYAPTDKVTSQDIAAQFKRQYPMVESFDYGLEGNMLGLKKAYEAAQRAEEDTFYNLGQAYQGYAGSNGHLYQGDYGSLINDQLNVSEGLPSQAKYPSRGALSRAFRDGKLSDEYIYGLLPQELHEPARAYQEAIRANKDAYAAYLEGQPVGRPYREPKWEAYTTGNEPGSGFTFGENYGVSAMTVPTRQRQVNIVPSETAIAPHKEQWEANVAQIRDLQEQLKAATKKRDDEMMRVLTGESDGSLGFEPENDPVFNPPRTIRELSDQLIASGRPLSSGADLEAQIPAATQAIAEARAATADPVRAAEQEIAHLNRMLTKVNGHQDMLHRKMVEATIEENRAKEPTWLVDHEDAFRHETHLPQAVNPVGHVRYKTAQDEAGSFMLFDESQSDMGQLGREEGFYDHKVEKRRAELSNQMFDDQRANHAIMMDRKDVFDKARDQVFDEREAAIEPYLKRLPNGEVDKASYEAGLNSPEVLAIETRWDAMVHKYHAENTEIIGAHKERQKEIKAQIDALPKSGDVVKQPYAGKTDLWNKLLVKRAIQEAVNRGENRVFIPGGQEHARRYAGQFRQAVNDISWRSDPEGFVRVYMTPNQSNKSAIKTLGDGERIRLDIQPDGLVRGSNIRGFEGEKASRIFGNALLKRMRSERTDHIDLGDQGLMLGAEGYAEHYERNTPKLFQEVMKPFDKKAKIERGTIRANGQDVAGTWVHLSDEFLNNYKKAIKDRGFAFYGFKKGGRVGYATDGGVEGEVSFAPDEKHLANLPKMAESKDAVADALSAANTAKPQSSHEFVQSRLFDPNDQKQLPQADPEAGERTAKQWGLGLYGMTNVGGAQEALGYMPKAEGGYENSALQDAREGHYGDAALKAMGVLVPGAGKVGKAAHAVEEALDTAKGASKATGAFEAAAPRIIRPQEIDTPTIRQVLEGNGYETLPDSLNFAGVLDSPMQLQTPKSLQSAFEEALKYHTSLGRKDRRENSRDAMARLERYLGQNSQGDLTPLLSENEKLKKAREIGLTYEGSGVETNGMALSPALQWGGMNICPGHAPCKTSCLGKKGGNYHKLGGGNDIYGLLSEKGNLNTPRANSLARTVAMMQDPQAFATRLYDELVAGAADANKNGAMLGARLNTLSDINPRVFKPFHDALDDIYFYDYTKLNTNPVSPNHHLTYSSTGISTPEVTNPHGNWIDMRDNRLDKGQNVAMAFSHKTLIPEEVFDEQTGRTYRVVNGVEHDFRPADAVKKGERGVIIGLKNMDTGATQEGAAKASNGFLVNYDPQIQREGGKRSGSQMKDADGKPIAGNKKVSIPDQRQFAKSKKGRASGGRADRALASEYFWQQFHNHDHYSQHGRKTRPEWWEIRSTPKRG